MRISKSRGLILSVIVLILLVGSNFLSGYINAFTEGIGGRNTFTTRNNAFTFGEIPTKGKGYLNDGEAIPDIFKQKSRHRRYSPIQDIQT